MTATREQVGAIAFSILLLVSAAGGSVAFGGLVSGEEVTDTNNKADTRGQPNIKTTSDTDTEVDLIYDTHPAGAVRGPQDEQKTGLSYSGASDVSVGATRLPLTQQSAADDRDSSEAHALSETAVSETNSSIQYVLFSIESGVKYRLEPNAPLADPVVPAGEYRVRKTVHTDDSRTRREFRIRVGANGSIARLSDQSQTTAARNSFAADAVTTSSLEKRILTGRDDQRQMSVDINSLTAGAVTARNLEARVLVGREYEGTYRSNGTVNISVTAKNTQTESLVGGANLSVTVSGPNETEVSKSVLSNSQGPTPVSIDLTGLPNGRYDVSVSGPNISESDRSQFTIGPTVRVYPVFNDQLEVGQTMTVAASLASRGEPVPATKFRLRVQKPNGSREIKTLTTGKDGFSTFEFSPTQTGRYYITPVNYAGEGTGITVGERTAEVRMNTRRFGTDLSGGQTAYINGFVLDDGTPSANTDFTIRIINTTDYQNEKTVTNLTTTTNANGQFVASWQAPAKPGTEFEARLYSSSNKRIPHDGGRIDIDDSETEKEQPRLSLELDTPSYQNVIAPGDTINATVTTERADGTQATNVAVNYTLWYGFSEQIATRGSVTTNSTGEAAVSIPVPAAAPDGATFVLEASGTVNGTEAREEEYGDIQQYRIDGERLGDDGQTREVGYRLEFTDAETGKKLSGIPISVAAETYTGSEGDVFGTGTDVTGGDGSAAVNFTLPSTASRGYYYTPRYPYFDGGFPRVPVAADISINGLPNEITGGETVSLNYTDSRPGKTSAVVALRTYEDELPPVASTKIVSEGENFTLSAPGTAERRNYFLQLYAINDSGVEKEYDEYVRVTAGTPSGPPGGGGGGAGVNLTGSVTAPDGSVPTGSIRADGRLGSSYAETGSLTTNGSYTIGAPANETVQVGFYQQSGRVDGVPDIYPVQRAYGNDPVDIGHRDLPSAHSLDVRVVDDSGTPVEGASVSVLYGDHRNFVLTTAETNSTGWLVVGQTPGIEVAGPAGVSPPDAGNVWVEATGPNGERGGTRLNVTRDTTVAVELQSVKNVSGRVEYPDGSSADGITVAMFGDRNGTAGGSTNQTASDGTFSLAMPASGTYGLKVRQNYQSTDISTVRDGRPDIYAVGSYELSGNTSPLDVGTVTLPPAHLLNISVVDARGTPVEDARVTVQHLNNKAQEPAGGSTLSNGTMVLDGTGKKGIEVAGTVRVEARIPGESDGPTVRTVTVNGPTDLRVTLNATPGGGGTQVDVDPSDLPGNGSQSNPYEISNASELQAIEDDLDANYALVSDIDASNTSEWNDGKGIDPLGGAPSDESTPPPFTGSLDGNNHTVTGLTIDRLGKDRVGLFGYSEGTVSNLSLTEVIITGSDFVGGLAGENLEGGNITSATASGSVTGRDFIGGLVGRNNGGNITSATASGSVDGSEAVGGLVGGNNGGNITSAAASSSVTGEVAVGGLVGGNGGNITSATASSSVTGSEGVGGLIGGNGGGAVRNATASGSVNGSAEVGGLVGKNVFVVFDSVLTGTIRDTFAVGPVSGDSEVGGVVGNNTVAGSTGTVTDSYWDTQATNQSNSAGNATGLTTTQMQGQAALTNLSGLDFNATWRSTESYPELRALSEPADDKDGGALVVENIALPDSAAQGQETTVNITLNNTDDTDLTQNVSFTSGYPAEDGISGGGGGASRKITVEADSQKNVSYTPIIPEDAGSFTVTVSTEDDTASATISNISEPAQPSLVVDTIQGPSTIGQTQRLSISATVTNPTSNNSTGPIEFVLDTDRDGVRETIDTRELTLAPGANITVGFTTSSSLEPGEYTYGITAASENERQLTVVSNEFETAVSTGDPHIVTFDGVAYDYMAAGEYTLVREPTGSLNIQARQEPVAGSDSVTINTALATVLDGQSVVIDVTDSTPVQINGTPTPIGDGNAVTVGDGTIERSGSSYVIVYPGENDTPDPTDERVIVDTFGNRIDIEVRLDSDRETPVEGVLGNVDGNSSNDIALANGTVVSDPSDSNELYGSFRDDWRVTENTTLFDYDGDNGPETYYDPAIPQGSFSVNDIDQDTRSEAEELAADAGLTPGTSAYRNALIDYALTGDESYFASAQQQNASTDVNETVTPSVPPELNGSNTLSVTARNASGDVVPGAEIKLYNDSFVILDSRQADQNGVASWSTLVPGEYNVELYGPDGAFWGGTSVTVDADGTNSTVRRTAPRLSRINLDGDENGEGGFYGGRPVTISPKIQNDGPERPVRVRIQVDTNNDDSVDKNATRGGFGTNISSGGSGFDGYEYNPSTNGTKQVRVITETYVNNKWIITDQSKSYTVFNIENNIVGYDPYSGEYDNTTTSMKSKELPASSTSLPNGTSVDQLGSLKPNGLKNITQTDKYPWSAVGAISSGTGQKGCTATLIEDNHVITAAHCVYNEDEYGGWLTNTSTVNTITFDPGRNHQTYPFNPNTSKIEYIQISKNWYDNTNRTSDMAILTINTSYSSQTGTFGFEKHKPSSRAYGGLLNKPVHVTGYPSIDNAPYVERKADQWDIEAKGEGTQVGELFPVDSDCVGTRLCHDYGTGGIFNELTANGTSGGPVWEADPDNEPTIISIHVSKAGSTGIVNATDNIGVRITERKYGNIGQMIDHGYTKINESNPNPESKTPNPPAGDDSGSATGDPHLTTYDGVAYDFQAAGEFILTNDSDGNPYVQARLHPVASRDVSVISAVATQLNGTNVTIDARDDQMLTVGDTTQSLATGESMTVGDGEIFRTPEKYIVVYPGADDEVDDGDSRLEATVAGDRLDVVVKPNRTAVDSMTGLLGSPDGNPNNDLMRADGTTLSAQPSFAELYGQYREDYRVTAENSLFDYDAGESAAGFYDPNYPSEQVTVDDLPADEREDAIDAATNAGLEPGTAAFHDAVLDYALTGNRSYLASAALAAEETDVTEDATPPDTPLTAPNLTVDTDQLATADDPLTVAVEAEHPNPDNVTLIISNGTGTVLSQEVSGAFTSEQTVSWNTTVAGEQVADGVYTLGVVATTDAGVRNVTTRGILVDNTAPSVTVETNSTTLSASADSTTIRFSYNDAASGVDPASITVLEDGANVTGSAQINSTHVNYQLTGLTPGETRTIQVQVSDEAGLTTNETATVSVASSGGTGTGGGSGDSSPGDSTDEFPLIDVDPTLTEEADVEQQTTEFDEADTVSQVTFEQGTQGSVTVSEFDGLPSSTVETIVERIGENVTAIDSSSEIDFVTVVDISPDSLSSDQSSATVELEVPSEQLDDPENAVIVHRTATGWAIQETTVQDVSGGTVTLTAPVDSFSLFAVVERSPSQVTTPTPTSPQATPGGTPEPEPETTSADDTRTPEPPEAVDTQQTTSIDTEPGGFNLPPSFIILVLIGVVIAAAVILRRRDTS